MGHRAVRTPEPLDRLRKGPVARQQLRSRRIHPADGVGEDQRADPSPTFGNPTDTRYIHEVVPFHERHVVSSTAARACSRHAADPDDRAPAYNACACVPQPPGYATALFGVWGGRLECWPLLRGMAATDRQDGG